MAREPLNLSESLRPWRQAGLRYVFTSQPRQPGPLEPSDWPSPWRELWTKVKTRPRQVWTYFELGEDLGGAPDPGRRALWQKMLLELAWPAGSVVFWPHSKLDAQGLRPEPSLFLDSLTRLDPAGLAVFGQKGLDALFPGQSRETIEARLAGIKILLLPGPEALQNDPARLKETLQSLTRA